MSREQLVFMPCLLLDNQQDREMGEYKGTWSYQSST